MSAPVPPRGIPGVPVVLTKPSLSPWFGPLAIVRSINVRLSNQACRVATSFLSCVTNIYFLKAMETLRDIGRALTGCFRLLLNFG